jgi:two-component sensor histidine kinase
LVNILVSDELEGTIELEKGPGTTFTITLPG